MKIEQIKYYLGTNIKVIYLGEDKELNGKIGLVDGCDVYGGLLKLSVFTEDGVRIHSSADNFKILLYPLNELYNLKYRGLCSKFNVFSDKIKVPTLDEIEKHSFEFIEELIKLNFDVKGLIKSGSAININEIC